MASSALRRACAPLAAHHAAGLRRLLASAALDDGVPLSTAAAGAVAVAGAGRAAPAPASADEWLAAQPRGAYTNARTVGRDDAVLELAAHLGRVSRSAAELGAPETVAEAAPELLLGPLRVALAAHREAWPAYTAELKLALLLTWGDGDGAAAEGRVHVAPLGEAPVRPVVAEMVPGGRANATAKDSAWVHTRRELEASKSPDANEVLMVDDGGRVLEGGSSNFIAVVGPDEVSTAGEGVLAGSIRNLVLDVCEAHGVRVRMDAPRAADAGSWQGALLTSTARLALPLDAVRLLDGTEVSFPPASLAHRIAGWARAELEKRSQRVDDVVTTR